jgi:hypothetical protein
MGLLTSRWALGAIAVAAGLLVAQFWLRPLWRDEYWALYFSAPHAPLAETLMGKMTNDVHPPLYFVILHLWRQISDAEIFARCLNLVVIGLGAWGAWALRGAKRPAETGTYLFLCASSFWLVFFGAEVRMMGALFVLCGLSVLIVRNALDAPEHMTGYAILYTLVGMLAASMHFFGALWIAALGGAAGFALLFRKQFLGFVTFGLASALAIAPAVAWIALVRPDQNPGAPSVMPPLGENLEYGANQLLRGLIVKTVFANLFAFIAAGLGVRALMARKQDDLPEVLFSAIALTIIIAFAIHLSVVSMIKERAFIVIIPALLYLVAAAISALEPRQRRAAFFVKWAPLAAALSLPLFSSELFKDRENVAPVRALLQAAPACANAPVVIVLRRSEQGWDFASFMTRAILKDATPGGEPQWLAHDDLIAAGKSAPQSPCPIKAIAIGAPRGERDFHEDARTELARLGLKVGDDGLEERSFGGGRTRVYIAPDAGLPR